MVSEVGWGLAVACVFVSCLTSGTIVEEGQTVPLSLSIDVLSAISSTHKTPIKMLCGPPAHVRCQDFLQQPVVGPYALIPPVQMSSLFPVRFVLLRLSGLIPFRISWSQVFVKVFLSFEGIVCEAASSNSILTPSGYVIIAECECAASAVAYVTL